MRFTSAFLALLFTLWTDVDVTAQENPLAYFRKDVGVVIRLREPDQTFEKVAKVVEKVQPGVGAVVHEQQDAVLGQLISNPGMAGVDSSRDWYVAVYAEKGADPKIVFAIPAIRAEEMVAVLAGSMQTQVQRNWVLYTNDETLPVVVEGETFASLLTDENQNKLPSGDLAVYVNVKHLSTVYAEQVELMQEKVLESLGTLRFMEPEGGVDFEAIAQLYGTLAEAFFKGVKDAESVSLSIALSDTEIALDQFVEFTPDSGAAKFLADNQQDSLENLARLPSNWPLYYGVSGQMKTLMQYGVSASQAMLKLGDEKRIAAQELSKDIESLNFGGVVTAFDVVDSSAEIMRGVTLTTVTPVEKMQEFTRKSQEKIGSFSTDAVKQVTTIQTDAEEYGNRKGDIFTVKQVYANADEAGKVSSKVQDLMFGPDGMVSRSVYLDNQVVSTIGGGRQLMNGMLSSIENQKSNKIEKYRTGLMPKANFVMLMDVAGLAGRALKVSSKFEESPLMINPAAIDNLNLRSSYLGFAVGSEGSTLKAQTRLPIDQITGLTKLGVLVGSSVRPGL
ncbi:hypothetical protein [Planctomicrobium sp. SH527]|uniref:hypothetical protein n=1 Tax=Planctomicrobium sp. SH527 TaxID=3448123 RepID=UPI003F5BF83D